VAEQGARAPERPPAGVAGEHGCAALVTQLARMGDGVVAVAAEGHRFSFGRGAATGLWPIGRDFDGHMAAGSRCLPALNP